jgi:hypothetical protein
MHVHSFSRQHHKEVILLVETFLTTVIEGCLRPTSTEKVQLFITSTLSQGGCSPLYRDIDALQATETHLVVRRQHDGGCSLSRRCSSCTHAIAPYYRTCML